MSDFKAKSTKFACQLGICPSSRGGAYSAPRPPRWWVEAYHLPKNPTPAQPFRLQAHLALLQR